MSIDTDNVWALNDDPRYNRPARRAPAYLTPAQASRWQRITHGRMLYRGEHYRYYIEQRRTMYEFPDAVVDGELRKHFVPYNLLKRISHTSADLLFGSEPLIRVADEVELGKLKAFADRCDLHAMLIEMEVECSFAAEAILEACIDDGETYLVQVPAEQVHPIGRMRPDRQFDAYVRYAETDVGAGETKILLILATTYREGSIERHCFQGEVSPQREVALASWPEFADGIVPPAIEPTGIDVNTIIWVPNLMLGGRVVGDYDDLLPLQDTLNAKQTQFARVIAKHANPKLRAPRSAADDEGNLRASSDVLYADNSDDWGYLTWDAQLDMAFKDREQAIDAMCVVSETSPVLLGIDKGGAPESARAMRLRASSSTAKAQRKATLRRPVLRWALRVVELLDQTIPGNRYDVGDDLSIEMRDGLPTDDAEQATTIATLTSAGAMSIERAVELQIPDKEAAAQEVARIKAEKAAAAAALMPDALMNEPAVTGNDTSNTSETTADDTSTEAA